MTRFSGSTPAAAFDASTCDPFEYFQAQELILNIDLCGSLSCLFKYGDWAGNDYSRQLDHTILCTQAYSYSEYAYCPGTCASYVSNPVLLPLSQ